MARDPIGCFTIGGMTPTSPPKTKIKLQPERWCPSCRCKMARDNTGDMCSPCSRSADLVVGSRRHD